MSYAREVNWKAHKKKPIKRNTMQTIKHGKPAECL